MCVGLVRRQEELGDPLTNRPDAGENKASPPIERPQTTVIVPAFNEEEGLPVVLDAIFGIIDDSYEVIVVDDGSTDDTAEAALLYPCRLVRHWENRGKGVAIRTALRSALGENVVLIDSDGTYPASAISEIVENLRNGYEYVRAIRKGGRSNIPRLNRVGNFILDKAIAILSGYYQGQDFLTGLYGIKKTRLVQMNLSSDGFDAEAEIAVKAGAMGLKQREFSITYGERIGKAKLRSLPDGFKIGLRVLETGIAYNPLLTFLGPASGLLLLGLVTLNSRAQLSAEEFSEQLRIAARLVNLLLGANLAVAGLTLAHFAHWQGIRLVLPRWFWTASRVLASRAALLLGLLCMVVAIGLQHAAAAGWELDQGPGVLLFACGAQLALSCLQIRCTRLMTRPILMGRAEEECFGDPRKG